MMKKLFRSLMFMAMSALFVTSCEDVPAPYEVPEKGDKPGIQEGNDGSVKNPYEVTELQTNQTGKEVWVHGFIVGSIPPAQDGSSTYLENMTFTAEGASTSNICIAASAQETASDKCVPVQVPVALRGKLVLSSNPGNLGREVWLKGTSERYYGAPGLKSVSKVYFEKPTEDKEEVTPPAGKPEGEGTLAKPYNVAAILALTKALPADQNSEKEYYFQGIVCDNPNINTEPYGNATYRISDDGEDNGNSFYVFRSFDLGNQKFTQADKIKKGDKVVICGTVVNYKGNTPETAGGKSYLISINGNTKPEGGDTPGGDTPGGTSEGLVIDNTTVTLNNTAATAGTENTSVVLADLGYENGTAVEQITMSDGTTITLSAGTNTIAPKYYSVTKGIRFYANNVITFNAKKPIAKVTMECDEYNGTKYVGNPTATIAVEGNTLTYCNASPDKGTQLRVKVITVTYAK